MTPAIIARLATNAGLRSFAQGIVVAALTAGWLAVRAAVNDGPVNWRTVAAIGGQAAVMGVLAYLGRWVSSGRLPAALPLNVDALVRAARTLLAGLAVTVFMAAVQAVQVAAAGGVFDVAQLARLASVAAVTAALAWLHRLILDPAPIPSLAPPAAVAA